MCFAKLTSPNSSQAALVAAAADDPYTARRHKLSRAERHMTAKARARLEQADFVARR
ncbi:hypothetical protein GCM10018952_40270 [Streptosporangium vulgare]